MSRIKFRYSDFYFLMANLDHTVRNTEGSYFSFAVSIFLRDENMQANIFLEQFTPAREKQCLSPIKMYLICEQI